MIKAVDIYIDFIFEHGGCEPTLEQFKRLGYSRTTYFAAKKEFKEMKEKELRKMEVN